MKNKTDKLNKLFIVKEILIQKEEKVLAVCTSRSTVESVILEFLRLIYPFDKNKNLFELEQIENDRLWYRNHHIKVIEITQFDKLIDWK